MAEAAEHPLSPAQMTLVDWLDDLTVRFLLNLPPAELSSVPRLCFQVEEAQWFYEDFIRPANPSLPSLNLRQFCMTLFQQCPLLSGFNAAQHLAAYEEFLAYKVRVPVRGAILMDDSMEKVLLVRGWKKGASWSFPRGKINKDEPDIDCAIREVYEETGFDIKAAGLVRSNEENGQVKAIDITMREQHMKLFVFRGVPLNTYFEPKTRKEISKIQWYNVRDLPGYTKNKGGPGYGQGDAQASKFYMVAPFLGHLKKWINHQRKRDIMNAQVQHRRDMSASSLLNTGATEDEGDAEAGVLAEYPNVPSMSADDLKRLLSIEPALATAMPSTTHGEHFAPTSTSATNLLAMLQGNQQPDRSMPRVGTLQHANMPPIQSGGRTAEHYHLQHFPAQLPQHQTDLLQTFTSTQHPPHQPSSQPGFAAPGPSIPLPRSDQLPNHHFAGREALLSRAQPSRNGQADLLKPTTVAGLGLHSGVATTGQYQPTQYPYDMPGTREPGQIYPNPQHTHHQLSSPYNASALPLHHQSPFMPTASGPQAPEASNLPAPKLSAHSMKLLDAFKSAPRTALAQDQRTVSDTDQQKAGNQQQAALLNLFKPQPSTQVRAIMNSSGEEVAAKSYDVKAEIPVPGLGPRKLTANEITRTLPINRAPKAPPQQPPSKFSRPAEEATPKLNTKGVAQVQTAQLATRPLPEGASSAAQKGATSGPGKAAIAARSPLHVRSNDQTSLPAPTSILQRPSSRHQDGLASTSVRPVPHEQPASTPQISILQRPGSSSGKTQRSPVPQSPLRNARHSSVSPTPLLKHQTFETLANSVSTTETPLQATTTTGKTDQLLALFGKPPVSVSSVPQGAAPVQQIESRTKSPQQDMLLNLFNNGSTAAGQPASSMATPPPAPQLAPERGSSRSQAPGSRHQTQQTLLNLFNVSNNASVASPGTPISPFSLGTPATKTMPGTLQSSGTAGDPRQRFGSVASVTSNGTNSGRQTPTPASATPTEAKGLLLDYLNGVVKEGYRGAKRSGI